MNSDAGNIGILGGTFDPVHLGHLHIAKAAADEFNLSEVWFMPAGDPYFKEGTGVTAAKTRLAMVEECLGEYGEARFAASSFEIDDTRATYTSDTLQALKKLNPCNTFFFIMGYDSLKSIDTWHEPGIIFKSAVILFAPRDQVPAEEILKTLKGLREKYPFSDIRQIHAAELDISSTHIRRVYKEGGEVSAQVTGNTLLFIKRHGLYLNI